MKLAREQVPFLRLGRASGVHPAVRPWLPGGERYPHKNTREWGRLAETVPVVRLRVGSGWGVVVVGFGAAGVGQWNATGGGREGKGARCSLACPGCSALDCDHLLACLPTCLQAHQAAPVLRPLPSLAPPASV